MYSFVRTITNLAGAKWILHKHPVYILSLFLVL